MNVVERQISHEINEPKRLAYLRGLAEKRRNDELIEMNKRCEASSRFCLSPEELRAFQLRSESERLAMKADEIERQNFSEEMIDKLLVVRECVREKLKSHDN